MDYSRIKFFIMNKWLSEIIAELKKLDKKIVIILVSILVIQTISYYFVSREFFHSEVQSWIGEASVISLWENLYWIVGDFCCFFIFPWFIIKIIFKEKLKHYGLKTILVYDASKYLLPTLLFILVISWFITSIESISLTHPILFEAKYNWNWFVVFELILFVYIFAWEFLWRGYMLFGLEQKFGWYAVFIQTIPFVILHNGKPAVETLSAIAGGIILGIIAIKTRTILYGVILHFGLIFFTDLFSVIRFRVNEFGVGIESLFNLIGK